MKHGDTFDPKYVYCSYDSFSYYTSSRRKVYTFTVTDQVDFTFDNTINIYPIRLISLIRDSRLTSGISSFSGVNNEDRKEDEIMQYTILNKEIMEYTILNEEVWQLTDEEAIEVLTEVV
jgi:hypothetical protein